MFDPRDTVVGWSLAIDGVWEKLETKVLTGLVSEGDTIVDVGANLGWFSVQLARAVGKTGRVIAFEPDPGNYDLLSENLRINGVVETVTAYRLAALNKPGEVQFELSPINYGDHRVRFETASATAVLPELENESRRSVIVVEAVALDDALPDLAKAGSGGPVRLMKLDCQGSEPAILKGARNILSNTEYLATEYWPYGLTRAGFDPETFIDELAQMFDSFVELEFDGGGEFQPIAGLRAHAASRRGPDGVLFYVLRKKLSDDSADA
ncbi:MAG: FkbM family methyltransferase [Gemmatimonadales bacterium]